MRPPDGPKAAAFGKVCPRLRRADDEGAYDLLTDAEKLRYLAFAGGGGVCAADCPECGGRGWIDDSSGE